MMSAAGLPLTQMSLAQQQGLLDRFRSPEPLGSLDELAGSALRVDYTQPDWFTWRAPGPWVLQWVAPLEPGGTGHRALVPPIREPTRDPAPPTPPPPAPPFPQPLPPHLRPTHP